MKSFKFIYVLGIACLLGCGILSSRDNQESGTTAERYYIGRFDPASLVRDRKTKFCFGNDKDVYLPDLTFNGKHAVSNGRGGKNFSVFPVERIAGDIGVTASGMFYLRESYAKEWFENYKGSDLEGIIVKGDVTDWIPVRLVLIPIDIAEGLVGPSDRSGSQ